MSQRGKINLIIFQTLIFSLLFALFGRLFYLQVLDSDRYQDAAISIQSRDIVTPAVRGAITDINGSPLVVDLPGLVLFADRTTLDRQADKGVSILSRVATLFKLEFSDIYQRTRLCGELPRENRAGCWNGTRYQPIPLIGNASQELALKVIENSDLYPGILIQSVPIRSYPSLEGENAAHVLGYVGAVTDEDLLNPEKNYYRSEIVGKSGLEVQYNDYLRGTPGVRTFLVNRKEIVTKESKNIKAIAGNNLITNINSKLQAAAEDALESAIFRARGAGYRGDSGAAVVMEIKTGRVLAMASYPTYDPEIWQRGLTVKQAKDLFSEAKWVRDGGLRPKSNPNDHFFNAAKAFNIDKVTGIDLPSELKGRLPDRQWKQNWYDQNKNFYCNYKDRAKKEDLTPYLIEIARENCLDGNKVRAGDAVNFSIGQGDTLVTPLRLAEIYAAIANDGVYYKPQVARAIVDVDGKTLKEFEPVLAGKVEAKQSTWEFLQRSLRMVVTQGTAAGVFAGFPVEVSGKTGTAQVFGRNPNGTAKDDTSWFAAYGPTKNPQYVVVMMVSQGGFGASTSGVAARDVFAALFGVSGNRVDPEKVIFPNGVPKTIAKVDLTKAAKESSNKQGKIRVGSVVVE